jgi:ParB-like chromosome segregation protein Spo0J
LEAFSVIQSTPIAPALVPLVALTPAPWNPRSIKDERFQNLCDSMESDPDLLWRRPILAQADGTIYAGNMRYRAAQHLGMLEVPAVIEDVSDQLARERALRDNQQWGQWEEDDLAALLEGLRADGTDLELLGFDERELQQLLDRLGKDATLADPDDVPDLPEEPITKPGDLWLLGDHRILWATPRTHTMCRSS